MNIFVVGAGFTKAVFVGAPLNRDLLAALALRSPDSAVPTLRDRYSTEDIEIAITRLDVDLSLSQDSDSQVTALRQLRQSINTELAQFFDAFRASDRILDESAWLRHFIDGAFAPGDVVVSLNYDCVLEGLLDLRKKWSPKGGYGSSLYNPLVSGTRVRKSPITVLKIHGSANFVSAPYFDKPARRAVNFNFDERFFPLSAKNTHFEYGAGTGENYVIAPSFVKIPSVEMVYLMLDAMRASSRAKNLIVIGTALRPEDSFLSVLLTKETLIK